MIIPSSKKFWFISLAGEKPSISPFDDRFPVQLNSQTGQQQAQMPSTTPLLKEHLPS
jgi:hypothetical protein